MTTEASNLIVTGHDEVLATEIGMTLAKQYEGFCWEVEPIDHNFQIRLHNVGQNGWGFFLNRKDIPVGSPERFRKMITLAGGELLERVNVARKAMEEGQEFKLFQGTEHKRNLNQAGIKQQDPTSIIIPGRL